VDLNGNILTCQNFHANDNTPLGNKHSYGYIADLLVNKGYPAPPPFLTWYNRSDCDCDDCPVIFWCRGGCPYNDPAWHEAECRSKYAYHLAVLAYCLFRIYGCLLTHIEGDFKFKDTKQLNLQTEVI
jgi:radical SAM protein with 4Fe4S-binding SPASM domain